MAYRTRAISKKKPTATNRHSSIGKQEYGVNRQSTDLGRGNCRRGRVVQSDASAGSVVIDATAGQHSRVYNDVEQRSRDGDNHFACQRDVDTRTARLAILCSICGGGSNWFIVLAVLRRWSAACNLNHCLLILVVATSEGRPSRFCGCNR